MCILYIHVSEGRKAMFLDIWGTESGSRDVGMGSYKWTMNVANARYQAHLGGWYLNPSRVLVSSMTPSTNPLGFESFCAFCGWFNTRCRHFYEREQYSISISERLCLAEENSWVTAYIASTLGALNWDITLSLSSLQSPSNTLHPNVFTVTSVLGWLPKGEISWALLIGYSQLTSIYGVHYLPPVNLWMWDVPPH